MLWGREQEQGMGRLHMVEGDSSFAVWPHLTQVQDMAKPHGWAADLDEGNMKAWATQIPGQLEKCE